MYPVYLKLGSAAISIEGMFAVGTLIIGFFYQRSRSLKAGYSHDWFVPAYTFTIVMGMVGAKLFHFLFWDTARFLNDPSIIFGGGGFAVLGSTIGAGFGGWLWCKFTKVNFLHWCDSLMIPILLCLTLGRVACFLNGDAFGLPTGAWSGVIFPPDTPDFIREWKFFHTGYGSFKGYALSQEPLRVIQNVVLGSHATLADVPLPSSLEHLRAEGVANLADLARYYPAGAFDRAALEAKGLYPFPLVYPPVHPTQIYEILLLLPVLALFFFYFDRVPWARQKHFFLFWFFYGIVRFVIEIWRFDRNIAFGIFTYAQVISVLLVIFGAAGVYHTYKKWQKTGVPAPILK